MIFTIFLHIQPSVVAFTSGSCSLLGEVMDGRGENSGIISLDISATSYSVPGHNQLWREAAAADTKSPFLCPFQPGKGHSREKSSTLALSNSTSMSFLRLPGKIDGDLLAEEIGARIHPWQGFIHGKDLSMAKIYPW